MRRGGRRKRITPKQDEAVELLRLGMTKTEVGKRLGVSRQTIVNWSQSELFQAAHDSRRSETRQACASALESMVRAAAATIRENLGPGGDPHIALSLLDKMGMLTAPEPPKAGSSGVFDYTKLSPEEADILIMLLDKIEAACGSS